MSGKNLKEKEIEKILKGSNLYYGRVYIESEQEGWSIRPVEIWTHPLFYSDFPITTQDPTCLVAQTIAEKYGVDLIRQDFSKGREKPFNFIFTMTCQSIEEIKQAKHDLQSALEEFQEKNK